MATTYLTRTPSSAGSATIGTYSAWVKRANISSGYPRIFHETPSSNNFFEIFFRDTDELQVDCYFNNSSRASIRTNRVFRDPSAWYHIVVATNSSQGTAADRIKVYVNGTQETSFSVSNYPGSGDSMNFNGSTGSVWIGRDGSGNYMDGSMAMTEWVDGLQLTPAYFGSTDSNTGIWTPTATSTISSYGTNGFKLKMDTATPGADTSGNTNNFTVGGGTPTLTQGSPSNVYATLNALVQSATSFVLASGNNKITFNNSGSWGYQISTIGSSNGKYYAEFKVDAKGTECMLGVMPMDSVSANQGGSDFIGKEAGSVGYNEGGTIYKENASVQSGLGSISNGEILGVAMDMDNNTVQFYLQGVSRGSAVSLDAGSIYGIGVSGYGGTTISCNFGEGFFGTTAAGTNADGNGQGLFAYAVPSGYYALNTKNLEAYG